MNFNITQMFVVKSGSSLLTSGNTSNLTEGQLGVFKSDYTALAAAPSVSTSPYIYLAQGSGNDEIGSFKTPAIYLDKVVSWRGESADTTNKEQITYVGYDEINDCKSPTIGCGKEYTLVIRVFEHYLRSVYCPYLQDGVVVKSACCDDCTSNCDSLDAKPIFDEFAEKINANPRLNKYISAEVVSKLISGSPATTKFSLVLPDPGAAAGGVVDVTSSIPGGSTYTNGTYTGITGTASASGTGATFSITITSNAITALTVTAAGSGYVIGETITISSGITGLSSPAEDITLTVTETDSAEGLLLGAIRDFYSSKVDDAETDIVFSSDSDASEGDANSTGNVMIEMTPSAGVTLDEIEDYNGVKWTALPCADEGTAVYAVGLKLTGITPAGLTSTVGPDANPYIANKTRFKVYAGEAPGSTQLEDMPNFCDLWDITTTQEVKYAIGEGYAIAEIERNVKGNTLPGARRFWIPYFNDTDLIKYFTDTTLEYDIYYLEHLDPTAGKAFENKTNQGNLIAIAVPSTMTSWKSSFESIMNTYLANSPAYEAAVTL